MRFVAVLLALLPIVAAAETAYVTDNLRLGLHRAEDTSDRAFRMLESGQAVEVLSRVRNFANVSLPDGARGYVKAAYLVSEKPAKLIVAETLAENERLLAEIEALKQQFAGPAARIDALENRTAELHGELEASSAQVADLRDANAELARRQRQFKRSVPLTWVGGAIGVCLVAGFLLGLKWVDHQSRKRHGGIRIY